MKFRALQDQLRRELWARIEAGELTGLKIAQHVGFKQAHVSNFLNKKRGLSLEAMDRVLGFLRLSVLDLLDPNEVSKRATLMPPSDDDFENVVMVEGTVAAGEPLVISDKVRDTLKFKKAFLKRLRPDMTSSRDKWQRFVLIKVDAREGMSMYPRMLPGATLLIDRHYNSLRPYRRNERNMYAIRHNGGWTVKYVEQSGRTLVLRPHNESYPVSVLQVGERESAADYLLGRVCHVAIET